MILFMCVCVRQQGNDLFFPPLLTAPIYITILGPLLHLSPNAGICSHGFSLAISLCKLDSRPTQRSQEYTRPERFLRVVIPNRPPWIHFRHSPSNECFDKECRSSF